jgi:hypothetical protein
VNGSSPVRRRFFLLLAPLLCASVALPAARSDAAEGAKRPAAEVAEGLNTIRVIADDVVSAGANKAKAAMIAEGIEPIWAKIEDTIKANDPNSYATFEKGIEGLEEAAIAGDAAKAGGSAGVIASAVKFYVAKFPGDAAATAPAPAAPGDRKAAAAPAPADSKAAAPAPDARSADAAAPAAADAAAPAAADAPEAGDANLARTGDGSTALTALAGAAFGLGGLSVIAGARRRRLSPIA